MGERIGEPWNFWTLLGPSAGGASGGWDLAKQARTQAGFRLSRAHWPGRLHLNQALRVLPATACSFPGDLGVAWCFQWRC